MTKRFLAAAVAFGIFLPLAQAQPETASSQEKSLPLLDDDAWVMEIDRSAGVATHRLTGMECPFNVEGMGLIRVAQYTHGGYDVGCSYRDESGEVALTYYMSFAANPVDLVDVMERNVETIGKSTTITGAISNEWISLRIGDAVNATQTCRQNLLRESRRDGSDGTTETILCQFGDWIFKTRVSWPNSKSKPVSADYQFRLNQSAAVETFSVCEGVLDSYRSGSEAEVDVDKTNLGLALATLKVRDISESEVISKPAYESRCVIATIDGSANGFLGVAYEADDRVAVGFHPASPTEPLGRATLWLENSSNIRPLLDDPKAAPTPYSLYVFSGPNEVSIVKTYAERPSRDGLAQDVISILSGQLTAFAKVRWDDRQRPEIEVLGLDSDAADDSGETE